MEFGGEVDDISIIKDIRYELYNKVYDSIVQDVDIDADDENG